MRLTGNEDLRVIKTIEAIKSAFEALICEKDYEKITVKELCERAKINKKTFYHYYETLDALLAEMQSERVEGYLQRVIRYNLPDEIDKVNREFFLYATEQGLAFEKITCGGNYRLIRDEMTDVVTKTAWSRSEAFQKLSPYEQKVLINFVNDAVLRLYREWVLDGKPIPVTDVVDIANKIVIGGVKGLFK